MLAHISSDANIARMADQSKVGFARNLEGKAGGWRLDGGGWRNRGAGRAIDPASRI